MSFYLEYIFAVVLFTECFAGFLVNGIILAAIFLKWKTLRSLQAYYKILSCLFLSRGLHLLSTVFVYLIFVFYPWILLDAVVLAAVSCELLFLYFTNLWFATVLCVFYCVKITSYNWKFFIFLKTKISTLVPWFLLTSLLISVSSSILFGFNFYDMEQKQLTSGAMENMTVSSEEHVIGFQKQFLIFFLGSCPPFLTFCVSISLLLHSLWMHTRRMSSSGSTFGSPNLESLLSAVKCMSFFLVLQIIYFIVMNVILSGRLQNYRPWRLFCLIIICCSSFLHSLYIISCNSDLKKTCVSMFHALTRRAQG